LRKVGTSIVFSPSDLLVFFESPFASWMQRQSLELPNAPPPDAREPEAELWARKGSEHEKRVASLIRAEHGELFEADADEASTITAMRAGRRAIYQAALAQLPFAGVADFLLRPQGDPAVPPVGAWRYTVADAKLARTPKPYALVQLCSYAEMLEGAQGVRPTTVTVFTGDGERHVFRTDDCFFYFRCLKQAFLELHESWSAETCPSPAGHADHGRWTSHAEALLEGRDDLSRVARITRGQIKRLAQAGVTTMAALAETGLRRVPRMDDSVYTRLREQARLQIMSRGRDRPSYLVPEIGTDTPRAALGMLPPPSSGDVFFDMEGFPLAEGGLEYLFGAYFIERGVPRYEDWWAHNATEERAAFERVIDWIFARFRADPAMHVYHYAAYEISALRRLMGSHATRGEELDTLLRNEVFVDLYKIVRNGVRIGEPRYSLKNVETFTVRSEQPMWRPRWSRS
jgi:predicted RecB family nuclease